MSKHELIEAYFNASKEGQISVLKLLLKNGGR